MSPCIANILAEYNQQDAKFHIFFISVRRSTCFRRFFRPSSGAQNCTYSVRYLSDQYLTLYVQFWAPDDKRKTRLKHVERLTEIKKMWNFASCWLYSANEVGDVSVYYISTVRKEGRRGFFCSTFPSRPVFPDNEQYVQPKHVVQNKNRNLEFVFWPNPHSV